MIDEKKLRELVLCKLSVSELLDVFKVCKRTLYNYLNRYNLHIINSPKFDTKIFDKIDTEEKSYWLGFLYADGYICGYNNQVELSLKSTDINHLYKFHKFLKDSREVSTCIKVSKVETYSRCRYVLGNNHFRNRLIDLGCISNKSLYLKFPDINIFSNKKYVIDFIRGYIDGDGCISDSRGRLRIQICGTKSFLTSLRVYFPEFSFPKKDKRSNVFTIQTSHTKADKVAKILYENSSIYLDRKFNKFAKLVKNRITNVG